MEKVSSSKLEIAEEIASWTVESMGTVKDFGANTFEGNEAMESVPSKDTEIVETIVSATDTVSGPVESVPDIVTVTVTGPEESVQDMVTDTVSGTVESVPDMVTEIVTETVVETIEPVPSTNVEAQSTSLTNIVTQSTPLTNTNSERTTPTETTVAMFESSNIESRVSPYGESASTTTFIESAAPTFSDSTPPSYMESAPSRYTDSMATVYSESRLQEAELIINLSSRNRRSLKNPTLTQVNTSISGSENYAPSLADPRSTISISDSFVNSITSLGETSASIEVQTDNEVAEHDAVGANEHDPILEDNTVAIMGQVTGSGTVLLNENSESGKIEESDTTHAINSDNVIVISMIDEDADQRRTKSDTTVTYHGEPTPNSIIVPSRSGRQEPFPTSVILNKHVLKGSDEPEITIERKRIHTCLVCNAKFKSIMDLFRHRVEHNEDMKSTFKCHICDHTCNDPVELEKHKMAEHSANKLYKCSICQDTFTLLHNYKCHLRIHNSIGPYVCNMCYRVFDKKSQFISHMDDHEFAATNPFRHRLQCNICDKIFSESGKLKRHMLTHSTKKSHKCEICSKGFMERHKLVRHMLSHTGKRDHQCPECEKSFTLKHNLTIHMRIHENLRPYQCLVCKRTFIQKIVLQRHLRIHQDYLQEQSHRFSKKYVN